jgi:transcriptional regulator with XRE-family HTH domain
MKGARFLRYWLIKKRAGQSQESVAAKCGISQNHLSAIENDIRRPSVDVAKRIAAVLNFDWTLFFEKK